MKQKGISKPVKVQLGVIPTFSVPIKPASIVPCLFKGDPSLLKIFLHFCLRAEESNWPWVKTNGTIWGVGEFNTHFRPYLSGWIGMFTGGTGFGF